MNDRDHPRGAHDDTLSTQDVPERGILVQLVFPGDDRPRATALAELAALAQSAGAQVVGDVGQNRRVPDAATFMGSGRLEELKKSCEEQDVAVVIFGHDLSPAQGRNLEEVLGLRVIDRSQLIMDLFALRARTYQARLQVELAQLQYSLPRLRRLWTHLDRYKGGIGMRGPGETQIEVDRREVRRKIADRNKRLQALEEHHQRQRENRSGYFTVGLLGYTNAGKSTLFNRLCEESVAAEDRPFSTLDTRTRLWKVGPGCQVLLSDTVGFIHNLPHHLIASFHATLAEAIEADLLLHVIDGAHENSPQRVESVEDVLRRIGAADRPRLRVVNKVDAVEDQGFLGAFGTDAVFISARTGEGVEELRRRIQEAAEQDFQLVDLRVPLDDGAALAAIAAHGSILQQDHAEDHVRVLARVPAALMGRLAGYVMDGSDTPEESA